MVPGLRRADGPHVPLDVAAKYIPRNSTKQRPYRLTVADAILDPPVEWDGAGLCGQSLDLEKAKGQDQIVASCPYRVIHWNAELGLPQKCGFCARRLDTGDKQPRYLESCTTGAMAFGDLDDPESEISKRLEEVSPEVFHPEFETGPLVTHAGLPGRMVAGEVVFEGSDVCAAGVKVTLQGDGVQDVRRLRVRAPAAEQGVQGDRRCRRLQATGVRRQDAHRRRPRRGRLTGWP